MPGWPYRVTTTGEIRVERVASYVDGRFLPDRPISVRKGGRVVRLSRATPLGAVRRDRSPRALRAEAITAWQLGLDPAKEVPNSAADGAAVGQ